MMIRGFTSRVIILGDRVRKIYHPQFKWQLSREVMFLKLLESYPNFPRLLKETNEFIEISYCGTRNERLSDYAYQKDFIIGPLQEQKVVHRDINPKNLLVLNDRLFLVDWGWAIFDYEKNIPTVRSHPKLGGKYYVNNPNDDSIAFDLSMID